MMPLLRFPAQPHIGHLRDTITRAQKNLTEQSQRWMAGLVCIAGAAILFLVMAASLSLMLNGLRGKAESAEAAKNILAEALQLEDTLDDANAALRNLAPASSRHVILKAVEKAKAANRGVAGFLDHLGNDAAAAQALGPVLPLLEDHLRTLLDASRHAGLTGTGVQAQQLLERMTANATAASRNRGAILENAGTANSTMFLAMGMALFAALAAPSLGAWGIYLLRRERAQQLRMELMHAQRLAVMGETAAMLAHEVSHPLTAANNYMTALKRTATLSEKVDSGKIVNLAEQSILQILRASQILQRLRRFIEKRESEKIVVAPSLLVEEAIALIGGSDLDVEICDESLADMPDVCIDKVQIQQVLINLMRNAIEAMKPCSERRLTISTAVPQPGFVQFALSDTGPGLPQTVADKLFQPFTSTKKDGLGIGLSICRSIIEDHHGTIWAEANPAGGTVFFFRLPSARGIDRARALR